MIKKNERLDVIIPIYNEEKCIDELMKRLLTLKGKLNYLDMSFIFINDGSRDRSLEILYGYAKENNFIKVINFSRNFGHQMAVSAGLDHTSADYVVIIDADLQDPPELIEEMYDKAKEGYDVVFGQRLTRKGETFFKKFTAKMFYRLLTKMCDVKIPEDTGDFRLISNKVLNQLKNMREKHRFLRGMVPWVGFKSTPFLYHRDERYAGETNYPLRKMIRFAKDAIFSFSNTPLKISNYVGTTIVGIGILGALFMLYIKLFTKLAVPGITALLVTVIVLGGIQILMLGIIGEYIGRIFEQSKNRPLYIVSDTVNLEENAKELINVD
jgi:dolichol-phosphate mannosyltransferase